MFFISVRCFSYPFDVFHIHSMFFISIRCFSYPFDVFHIHSMYFISIRCFSYPFDVFHIHSMFVISIRCFSNAYNVFHMHSMFFISIRCFCSLILSLFYVLFFYQSVIQLICFGVQFYEPLNNVTETHIGLNKGFEKVVTSKRTQIL